MNETPIHFRGNRIAQTLLRLAGWRVRFDGLPALQGVIVVYPHTSNWDFPVALLAKWAIGLPVKFWGKDSLFRYPLFGRWMRAVGGIPVDRSAPQGVVQEMAERFAAARANGELFWLALSPEGTRSYREHWRSGFYHLVLAADVPLGLVTLDWGRREVGVQTFVRLGGEPALDMALIADHLHGVRGRRPERAAPVTLSAP